MSVEGFIKTVARAGTPLLCVGLVGALLSGCALNEKIITPQITLPQAFEAPQGASGSSTAALDRWWLLFNDAQLTTLVEQALVSSPDARSAFYRVAEARADRNEIIAGVLPQGDIKASGTDQYAKQAYSNLSGGIPPQFAGFFTAANGSSQNYAASFPISWEIDLYGKNITAIKAADANFAAARFDYEATRMSLAAEVATDLFQARGLAVQLDDARENERLARNLADVARRKAEAGLATTADAARTESDAESNAAQSVQIEAQLKGAQRALLVLIGKGGAPSTDLPITADVTPPPSAPATTPGSLLARRPDVREAQEKLLVAAGQLRIDKLALFPTFTLMPGLSYSKQVESIYTITTQAATGGVGVTVPVFSLPKLLSEVRAQGARGDQAVVDYEKSVQSAYGDAERALTAIEADDRRVKLLDNATKRSRFAFDAANKGYDLGLTDLTSLIQAEQTWRQTRATYTASEISALVDTVATFKALGGGWNAEAAQGKNR